MLSSPDVSKLLGPVTITDLTVEGGAIARHEGRVIFLDSGLPQEIVRIEITGEKKNCLFGKVIETLQPSPLAKDPWCPHFPQCGACMWQNMQEEAVLSWKEKHIQQTLSRIGKITDITVSPIVASSACRARRNKMSYAFGFDTEGNAVLGLRQRASHDVVDVAKCGIQAPDISEMLGFIQEKMREHDIPVWSDNTGVLRFIVIHTPDALYKGRRQIIVECITSAEGKKTVYKNYVNEIAIELMQRGVTGFIHTIRTASTNIAQGERIVASFGDTNIFEAMGDICITAPFSSFLQTNTQMATLLYTSIAEHAALTGVETIWDLYSGVGSIAFFLAGNAAKVHGFEMNKEAVTAAKHNSQTLGYTHCRFTAGDIAHTLQKERSVPHCIITDPPRSGMDMPVIEVIKKTPAKKLIYVSCDVATQARDIARLSPEWKSLSSHPFDMFPNTQHCENIVVLERVK